MKDYLNEKYYIRYEKGGDTINDIGILNNYYKPVEYYFPWDVKTVQEVGKINGLRNKHRYFQEGIGVSTVGAYAPIFRHCKYDVFFNNYNIIILKDKQITFSILPILTSKIFRYLLEHFENHTVAKNQIDLLRVPLPDTFNQTENFEKFSKMILLQLKKDINYDYASNEQIIIDQMAYELYDLNVKEIEEVENWYARRYPKLSAAQKENLRKLGKSDDYLVLYGYKKEGG